MKKQLLTIIFLLVLLCPLLGISHAGYAQTGTVVRVAPQTVNVEPSKSFSVDIIVENVVDLYGFDVSVKYDPAFLSLESVELGDFLESGIEVQIIDKDLGLVNYFNAQTYPAVPKSGSGILITIHFTALSTEETTDLLILEPEGMPLLSSINGELIPCLVDYGVVMIGDVQEEKYYSYLPLVMR